MHSALSIPAAAEEKAVSCHRSYNQVGILNFDLASVHHRRYPPHNLRMNKETTLASLSKLAVLTATVALLFSGQVASAQGIPSGPLSAVADGRVLIAQASPTILPTDIVPLPALQERQNFGQTFKLKALEFLPAKFYFSATTETSLRDETNVYQYPTKRQEIGLLGIQPSIFLQPPDVQQEVLKPLSFCSVNDGVFRVFPNLTAGWAFTDRTRIFANYFLIRDELFHNTTLNSLTQSVGGGLQHDFPLNKKAMLQANLQFRELFQNSQIPVFDYLPGLTYQNYISPHSVAYLSTLLQLRGKQPFVSPNREIDPFYTLGYLRQQGRWTCSAAGTFLQNFRQPFAHNAFIPFNNYSFILDFELDRQILKSVPGLQAFLRVEPIYNFHSKTQPGISGMDFRIFCGLRITTGKVPLTAAIKQLRDQLQETQPIPPPKNNSGPPSTTMLNSDYVASRLQPIHGYVYSTSSEITTKLIPQYDARMLPPKRIATKHSNKLQT
jgi:hypothetical protein